MSFSTLNAVAKQRALFSKLCRQSFHSQPFLVHSAAEVQKGGAAVSLRGRGTNVFTCTSSQLEVRFSPRGKSVANRAVALTNWGAAGQA